MNTAQKITEYEEAFVKPNDDAKPPSVIRFMLNNKEPFWLSLGETQSITFNNRPYHISFFPNIHKLPFEIYLKKFEIGYDPGTQTPASYKSYITLQTNLQTGLIHSVPDGVVAASSLYRATARGALSEQATTPTGAQSINADIYMNNPLHFQNLSFYQSSYQLRDGAPPISVFSVNDDPGRWIKYCGSILIVLGIAFMFYFNKLLMRENL